MTVGLNVRVQDGTEEANDVTTLNEKRTLNEDAKKNDELTGTVLLREKC